MEQGKRPYRSKNFGKPIYLPPTSASDEAEKLVKNRKRLGIFIKIMMYFRAMK